MNLSTIAKAANVSVSTVSKAFSDSSEISKETKEMIIDISKQLGCYEKYYKPKYEKKLIAVICPELLGIHYSQMATFIEKDVASRNGTTVISVTDFSPSKQAELIDYYVNFAHADGIIVIEPVSEIKKTADIPIVQIALNGDSRNVHCITMDINNALDEAMQKIKESGHSKIGFVGEKYTPNELSLIKKHVYENGLELKEEFISINDHRFFDCGYYGMDKFIKKKNLPTVIFAAYSHIATGILQRLNEEHISVPDNISVICMDDIAVLPYNSPDLSCIRMHLDELCSEAIHLIYRIFSKRYTFSKHTITVKREFYQGETLR